MDNEAVPQARARISRQWIVKLAVELMLIAVAVFIALLADEWRERRGEARQAADALQRFSAEITQNRASVERVASYHREMQDKIDAYLRLPAAGRPSADLAFRGIQPAWFEQTAWDLAVATGALAHIDPDVAFPLARTYSNQRAYAELTQALLAAMYQQPPGQQLDRFLGAVKVYYDDIVSIEPALLKQYDELQALIRSQTMP